MPFEWHLNIIKISFGHRLKQSEHYSVKASWNVLRGFDVFSVEKFVVA